MHRMNKRLVLAALLMTTAASAQSSQGTVAQVSTGSIFVVHTDGEDRLVSLYGVEAPSPQSLNGKHAKLFAEQRLLNQPVTVRIVEERDGLTFVELTLSDGTNLSHRMLREGLVRWDSLSAPEDTGLRELEQLAHDERRGLWYHPSLDANPAPAPVNLDTVPETTARIRRAPSGTGYQVLEADVLTDDQGTKTLVMRGNGVKNRGFERAVELRRIAAIIAAQEEEARYLEEQIRLQAEQDRAAYEAERIAQEEYDRREEQDALRRIEQRLNSNTWIDVSPVFPNY